MSAAPTDRPAEMPAVLGGLTAYLQLDGASKAADFYTRAFGAKEVFRVPADDQGRTMHIHLYVNGSSLMLSDAYPEYGHALEKPQAFNLTLEIRDRGIDFWWQRAIDAGATEVMPVQDMFWGARYGQLRDPFGVLWSMNEPKQ